LRWRAIAAAGIVAVAVVAGAWMVWKTVAPTERAADTASADTVRTIRAGDFNVIVRAPGAVLRQGRNAVTIEFRSAASGELVDAGTVNVTGNMSMPGMLMSSDIELERSRTPGVYTGSASFGMAGTWQMSLQWDGPAGRGSTSFEGKVQ
jgi:hypothetical protein